MVIWRDSYVVPACHYCYGRHTSDGIPTVHDCMEEWDIKQELGLEDDDEIASDLKCGICGCSVDLEDGFWTIHRSASDGDHRAPRTRRRNQPGTKQKHYLVARDRLKCRICLRELTRDECTAHHVHPSSKGGLPVPENLVIACDACNQSAGTDVLPQRTLLNSEYVRELSPDEMERIFDATHTPEEAREFFEEMFRRVSDHVARHRATQRT